MSPNCARANMSRPTQPERDCERLIDGRRQWCVDRELEVGEQAHGTGYLQFLAPNSVKTSTPTDFDLSPQSHDGGHEPVRDAAHGHEGKEMFVYYWSGADQRISLLKH